MTVAELLKKENNNIDLFRIILASLVIVGHTVFLNGQSAYWVDPITWLTGFTYSGAFAVKLFFFISGLVVTNSLMKNRNPINFGVSRAFRLLPALAVVVFLSAFLIGPLLSSLPAGQYFASKETWGYAIKNLYFNTQYLLPGVFSDNFYQPGAVNGSLWSLAYEVGCYVALLGIFLVFKDKRVLSAIALLLILEAFLPNRVFTVWIRNNPEVNLLPASFAFGALLAINADRIKINGLLVLGAALIAKTVWNTPLAEISFILASAMGMLWLSGKGILLKLKPKHDISYGIYLWGFLIQQAVYHFIGPVYAGLHCLISVAVAIVLGWLSYRFVEKPCMALGKRCSSYLVARFGPPAPETSPPA